MEVWYIFGSVLLVSLLSLVGSLPLLLTKQASRRVLLVLIGLSVGALLGSVFIHFLPEAMHEGDSLSVALKVIAGFLAFFLIEKLVHHHHNNSNSAHHHAYQLAPLNIIGDAIHNFIDGIVIAASYLVSIPLGIAATLSVVFHELPQEIADFGILLYAGLSKKKALLFNFLAAMTSMIGAAIGIVLGASEEFVHLAVPFAAGVFLYIAAANLIPELHKERKILDGGLQFLAIIAGVAIMVAVNMYAGH